MVSRKGMRHVLTLAMVLAGSSVAFASDDGIWSVSKSSGDVWLTTTGAAPASLTQDETLKPGDTIRTGRNGRVLLVRGEETILIAPNSVIGVPTENKDGMSTTILQQAGSILLEVEKRNVKHFEVETPYLAAVVKGTQFSVTVNAANTRVEVSRGQVEVADFKSGEIAQVLPGQAATSFANGKSGLSLSGSGTFNPIEHGKPRASTIDRIPVPKGGLHAPNNAGEGKSILALGPLGSGKLANNGGPQSSTTSAHVIRLSNALGEIHLNVHKATHGLAHGAAASGSIRNASHESKDTIWSDKSGTGVTALNSGSGNSSSAGSTSAPGSSSPGSASVVAAGAAAAGDSASAAKGNGNGNANGVGNGNGNGATGNGATGNGGVGNGNGKGNGKH